MPGGMIAPDQVKLIHALKGALRLDDATYRDMLHSRFRKRSSKQLTRSEARDLIREMESNAFSTGAWRRREKKYDRLVNRRGFASPKQLRMIEGMWKDVSRAMTDKDRAVALRPFLMRIVGIEDMRFLEPEHVRKVINALKSMRAAKAAYAFGRETKMITATAVRENGEGGQETRRAIDATSIVDHLLVRNIRKAAKLRAEVSGYEPRVKEIRDYIIAAALDAGDLADEGSVTYIVDGILCKVSSVS
jgi:phage gp16-like protein